MTPLATPRQLRELVRIMACITTMRPKYEHHPIKFFESKKRFVSLSLSVWAPSEEFDTHEALKATTEPAEGEAFPLNDGVVPMALISWLKGTGMTSAQAIQASAQVAAGEMADVVRVFETFLRTTRLSFTRDLGATPTFLSAAGTTVTPHRIDCDCCGKRATSSWYIPTLQGCGNDEEKRAWQRIHRQTVRRRTDEEFQSMDLLMLPRVELPPEPLQRRPSQKGRE
jgi:hypothetical protein